MPSSNCACKGCRACGGRCGNIVRKGRCAPCTSEMRRNETVSEDRRERNKLYETKRWKGERRRQLAEHPFCCWVEDLITGRECGRLATDVDHIKPRATHPELEWERSNFQSLCHRHHSMKTAIEMKLGATITDR